MSKQIFLLQTMLLVLLAMFSYSSSAYAQVETTANQNFTINGDGWNKVIHYGDPVTIFSYKDNSGTHSFGIYSDDYAGIIDMRIIPFNVDSKQLKKLPSNGKKKLNSYYDKARSKAREKALAGKYKTIVDNSLSGGRDVTVHSNEPFTIIGYQEIRKYLSTEYCYSVVNDNGAGICYRYEIEKTTINNVPLPFLPSTSDPQVLAFIKRENQRIKDQKAAEMRARNKRAEEERRIAAERKARQAEEDRRLEEEAKARHDSLTKVKEKEYLENMRSLAPAFIHVSGWDMDSAGGITVNIGFTNCSSQTVKYVYFRGYFLNAVGDKCRNEITGSIEWRYRGVGPLNPLPKTREDNKYDHADFWNFGNPKFYASTAHTFRLSSVTIEYMNGKKTTLSGAELKKRVKY